ncbi:phage tail tape measure protein [Glutamicibacter sp. V16R2B1]|uniref:phage tail tape measure protein n=1 Tax=Glutamicibacter sp. V16R2B1 TaxID=2036207 RepID=UPI0010FE5FD2|nr:phage tail tape measure protein [Glutamicibacter sp. V16R2B1]TLK56322.1 phage tail tape measure protein [Glutamicibacter sp. V16R2B1]
MATRDIVVRIRAEVGAFKKDMDAAAAKAKETAQKTEAAGKTAESGIGRLAQTAKAHEKAWSQVSTGMVAGGTAIVGALGLSTKAAMDWESAFTGVKKTVEGTPQQLARVEDGLRGLARTLPATHTEIAAVAEAAGQLGIQTDNVVDFTKVMIDLGESTNMTAEQGAMEMARFMNIMGTSQSEVGRLGATIVGLGNNFAATESEIMAMSMRLAAAGKLAGLSEGQVMGLATSMSAVGIEAEAGGTAMTQVLTKIGKAVDGGGEKLGVFATTSGMTSEQFQKAWKEDASGALDTLLKGLGQVESGGQSMNAVLDEMGIKGIRESLAMKNLALASAGVGEAMTMGAQEYDRGMALIEEADKRYATAESKVKIAWNTIKDAAISAGSVILPVVAGIADAIADLAGWFADLPAPVQGALTAIAGIAGVSMLAAGALMKIVPGITTTIGGLKALGSAAGIGAKGLDASGVAAGKARGQMVTIDAAVSRTEKNMTRLGKGAKLAAQGLLAMATVGPMIGSMVSSGDLAQIDEMNAALLGTGNIVGDLDSMFSGTGNWFNGLDVSGIEHAFQIMGDPSISEKIDQNVSKFLTFGTRSSSNFEFAKKNFEQLDGVLASMAKSGNADAAAEAYDQIAEKADAAGFPVEKLAEIFPQYAAALKLAAAEGDNADFSALAADLGLTSSSAEDAAKAIDDFYQSMVNAGMVVLSEREALRGMQEAFDAAGKAAAENGKNLDITTEKGRANQAALDGIASSTFRAMEAQREAGATAGDLGATISQGREAFIQNATAMGMSAEAAGKLADQMNLIPGAVYIQFDSNTGDLAAKLTEIHELVQSTPDGQVTITENSPEVKSALEALGYIVTTLPDGRIKVSETGTTETGKKIDATAGKKRTAKINAEAITGTAETTLANLARQRTATIVASVIGGPLGSVVGAAVGAHRQAGGRLPGLDTGGRLPATGLGTDKILAVNAAGVPIARVDDREWVVNRRSSDKHDELLSMINRDDPRIDMMKQLVGLAGGGRVGAAEKRVQSLQRAYSRISGDKANRARKLAAKDQLDAAKAELKAVKEQSKRSAEAAKDAKERANRLSESRRDLRVDLRRGTITDAFTSGSGLSQVDKLLEVSRNADYSAPARKRAAKDAAGLEKALASLTSRSEKLKTALEEATKQADELRSVRDAVAGDLRGEFALSGSMNSIVGPYKTLNAKGIINTAKGAANRIAGFGKKLDKLRGKGYSAAIVEEVAGLGSAEGGKVADALLAGSKSEVSELNKQYRRLDYWSGKAGDSVTKSMYKGGVDAADGLVRGLQGKSKDVENAFYKLGKSAEKSFKRSLGIKSPSRVMMQAGVHVGEGAELGILSKVGDVSKAAERLMAPPALAVPPSPEVARYASAQSASSPISADAIAAAVQAGMAGWQPMVQIDGRKFYGTMQQVAKQYGGRR